jgi:hypothetical protein
MSSPDSSHKPLRALLVEQRDVLKDINGQQIVPPRDYLISINPALVSEEIPPNARLEAQQVAAPATNALQLVTPGPTAEELAVVATYKPPKSTLPLVDALELTVSMLRRRRAEKIPYTKEENRLLDEIAGYAYRPMEDEAAVDQSTTANAAPPKDPDAGLKPIDF